MPSLIEHIDAICRRKGRDVLYIVFSSDAPDERYDEEIDFGLPLTCSDWRNLSIRRQIIDWLDQQQIEWQRCGHFANEGLMLSYQGQIYVDVPFDTENPTYRRLRDYLETPEGTMRFPNATFCYLQLDSAMKNAHHDEPGFWERWAENF